MTASSSAAPVIVVGASLGGLRAAESLRRAGYAAALTVIGAEAHAPYNRPPLSKDMLVNDIVSAAVGHDAVAFPQRAATADVEWMLGTRVDAADLDDRTVTTHDGVQHPFAALVIATGLRPRRLTGAEGVPLPELRGRYVVRTLDDAIALRAVLAPGTRVVVAGSGFVGCEVAAAARKHGCSVTVVSPGTRPLESSIGPALAAELQSRHESHGVEFRMRRRIVALEGRTSAVGDPLAAVVLDDGSRLPADVLVEAIGSECATGWLTGTDLDLSDGVLADSAMRAVTATGAVLDDVYVVGDVARFPNAMFDPIPRRIEHWNIPTDTAKRAGPVLAAWLRDDGSFPDVAAERFAPMPAFWSNQFEVSLQAYGLPSAASESRILEGDPATEAVVGFYRRDPASGERLIGVVGLGMKAALLPYRQLIADGGRA